MNENLQRMIALVGEVFDVKNDPDQLDVTPEIIQQLQLLHPATLTQIDKDGGPILWVLVIPTTKIVMDRFLAKEISESQLFTQTKPTDSFEAIYLCSATLLPEYRNQGIAKTATVGAINKIVEVHNIKALYYWEFTNEGGRLANAIAMETGLPLYVRDK